MWVAQWNEVRPVGDARGLERRDDGQAYFVTSLLDKEWLNFTKKSLLAQECGPRHSVHQAALSFFQTYKDQKLG